MKYINTLGAIIVPFLLVTTSGHTQALHEEEAPEIILTEQNTDEFLISKKTVQDFLTTLKSKIKSVFSDLFAPSEYNIAVMADVEGNWDKVKTFVDSNDSVGLDAQDNFIFKNKNAKFVCLGDVTDKGKNNIKILRALVKFKKENPERVILLLGNRDINKTRFNWELSSYGMQNYPGFDREENTASVWKKGFENWKGTPADLKAGLVRTVELPSSTPTLAAQIDRLEWLTANTYGAPEFFDNIKAELNTANDADVMKYIMGYAKKGGDYYEYQKYAHIIYYDAPTKTLFAHGGIFSKDGALGAVPWSDKALPITTMQNFKDWLSALNSWAHTLIELGADADGSNKNQVEKILPLIRYQEPLGTIASTTDGNFDGGQWSKVNNDKSVVVGRPWDKEGNLSLDNVPVQALATVGVLRMIVGHSPVGQVPVVMRSEQALTANDVSQRFEVVAADTSFSAPPRVAAVMVKKAAGQKGSFVSISANYEKKNIAYSTKSDDDIGRSHSDKTNRTAWNLGWSNDSPPQRLTVSFPVSYPREQPTYTLTPAE